jgi:hypothetical protein
MFSRDPKHYRPTPRSLNEAFGPYHRLDIAVCRKHERLCAIVGVIFCGVLLGIALAS